jgi:hypothetical protein
MNKFIFDIMSNPDMLTYSSKRAGGFISLFATIIFGIFSLINPMTIMAGLTVAFFGLASLDYKAMLVKQENKESVTSIEEKG